VTFGFLSHPTLPAQTGRDLRGGAHVPVVRSHSSVAAELMAQRVRSWSYCGIEGSGRRSGSRPAITAAGSASRRWVRLTTRRSSPL
jgi:hypothetical protein